MATESVKVMVGTKIEEKDAKKLDATKMALSISGTPPASEVEGQALYVGYTRCPWCGNVGRSVIDTSTYNWYRCGSCGGAFKA
jgi:hypothetical protein